MQVLNEESDNKKSGGAEVVEETYVMALKTSDNRLEK